MNEILDTTCGHPATPSTFTTGYARTDDGRVLCFPCADQAQLAEMATQDVTYAYLSDHGKNVTTWTGGVLMRVTSHTTGRTGFYGSTIHYVRAVEADGTRWYGKNGGPSMSIAMRRAKG